MAASDVSICNIALGKLGAQHITSLTENSKNARACNKYYAHVRDMVLRSHPWNCAIQRQPLAQLSEGPVEEWNYQYQLPADPYCLRVLSINEADSDSIPAEYAVEGRKLLTNEDPVVLKYIRRLVDASEMDELLVEAVAAKLAATMAYDIVHDAQLKVLFEAEYSDVILTAMDVNAIESEEPEPYQDTWTAAGRG